MPRKVGTLSGWLWFFFSRIGTAFAAYITVGILLFSLLPVPFSAYMVQKKAENLITGNFNYVIRHDWVNLNQVAWQMQMAVIAAEDQKFGSHFGIDLQAIETAWARNANAKKVRGASTISQQTVKNMFLWHGSSWIRKGIELPLTFVVEKSWGKRRILEIYLNIAEFGEGIFGVEAAAQHFFKKSAQNLTLQESALLAASLPNPLAFRVEKPGPIMRKRQAWIMRQVNALGGRRYLDKL